MRIVGLEKTLYEVSEDVGEVEVCANVTAPELECPLNFPFTVTLYSVDNTAGNVGLVFYLHVGS